MSMLRHIVDSPGLRRVRMKCWMSLVLLLGSALGTYAQGADHYCRSVAAIFVMDQKDAPVRIVDGTAFVGNLQIENLTGPPVSQYPIKGITPNQYPPKKIVALQLGYVTEVPPDCSDTKVPPVITLSKVEKIDVDAGKITVSNAFASGTRILMEISDRLNARRVFTLFGPVYVRFEDETEWRFDLPKEGSFDSHQATRRAACTPGVIKTMDEHCRNLD